MPTPCHCGKCDWCLVDALPQAVPVQVSQPHPTLAKALACVHKGPPTGRLAGCGSCGGKAAERVLEVKACAVFGECTDTASTEGSLAFCQGCTRRKAPLPEPPPARTVKWTYAVTTVPGRRADLLPRTLSSLKAAGFDAPRLFVDGDKDVASWEREFGLEVTVRYPRLQVAGNWLLTLHELLWRDPTADRYAIFQDDFVTVRNLRPFLDRCKFPAQGYWNLYTDPRNQRVCPEGHAGWYESNQLGRGAVALVFSRDGVTTLLSQKNHIVERPLHLTRGWRSIDGGISDAMRNIGWKEWVHNPSLVQHTGRVCSFDKRNASTGVDGNYPRYEWGADTFAVSFPGEDCDALSLPR